MTLEFLENRERFSERLFEKMQQIDPAVCGMELYEFRYALDNVTPAAGWNSIQTIPMSVIEAQLNDSAVYSSIKLRPKLNDQPVMDEKILLLMQMLFVGLLTGAYPVAWVNEHFYFDVRGFYFLHRTRYFTPKNMEHLGGEPYRVFEAKQKQFETTQSIGYQAFKAANAEIDQCFIEMTQRLVERKGTPILIAIAGQTAAGKTEITARLFEAFKDSGKSITTIEMDHFFTDRDYREAQGFDSLGKDALHYEIFKKCLRDICQGKRIITPRYDFISATSSHTVEGELKEGCIPIEIEPADIIFMEGNFPFLLPEIAPLIGIKAMYLTDDAIRMKRKWKRDMDYRKKYDLYYFLNRYFREQFLMAEQAYIPQLERCDIAVDTTAAKIWATPAIKTLLD